VLEIEFVFGGTLAPKKQTERWEEESFSILLSSLIYNGEKDLIFIGKEAENYSV
jgi:hypothetical protein